jgi:hypothetical protein
VATLDDAADIVSGGVAQRVGYAEYYFTVTGGA